MPKGEAVVEGVAVDYQLDIAKVLQDVAKVGLLFGIFRLIWMTIRTGVSIPPCHLFPPICGRLTVLRRA